MPVIGSENRKIAFEMLDNFEKVEMMERPMTAC